MIAPEVKELESAIGEIWEIAGRLGLDPYPVHFEMVPATIKKAVPAATSDLPSMALSLQGGGSIGLDPAGQQDPAKTGEPKALTSVFVFDLEFSSGSRIWTLGNRVHVRFNHDPEPLGLQAYRNARRLFLAKFNV